MTTDQELRDSAKHIERLRVAAHGRMTEEETIRVAIGRRVEQARKRSDLTADQLECLAGVGERVVRSVELGRVMPRLPTLMRLATVLGVSLDWLVKGEGRAA